MNGFLRFLDGMLSFAFVALVVLAALGLWLHQSFDKPGPLTQQASVVVPKGVGTLEIAERLERSGIVADRRLFMLQYYMARVYGGSTAVDRGGLKAGEYQFEASVSPRQVLDTISSGKSVLLKVTVPEGLTSQQIIDRLQAEAGLSGEVTEVPPEGSLLPDTYKFARGTTRQEIIDRMRADHAKTVAGLWATRQEGLPVQTPEQALILASIVEKETGKPEERPRVAAVFVNRMRRGMRLQSDPTIIYGLVGGQGSLGRGITRSDIDSKTPYNTYQIEGLPPGPICNPGRAAIAATLNPAQTQDLYFVADGTGGHTFTTTLKDHNSAVANWRRIERGKAGPTSAGTAAEAPAAVAPPAQAPSLINATKAGASGTPEAAKKAKRTTQQ